jgi:4-amino-4-deoxy-L-arabinose transferase-like glycosyltransferase
MSTQKRILLDPPIIGLWAAAVLLRLALIPYAGCVHSDSVTYLEIARRFVEHGVAPFHTIYPPLYPAIIGCLAYLGLSLESAARLGSALLGGTVILPVAWLGCRIYGIRVARYAAAILVIHPVLVAYGTYALTEATYTTLLATGIALGLSCLLGGHLAAFAGAGLVFGLGALLRPEALAYVPLVACVGLYRWRRCGVTGKRTVLSIGLLAGVFLIVCLPYAHYMKQTTGSWALTGKTGIMLTKSNAVGAHDLGAAAEARQRTKGREEGLLADLARNPVKFAARSAMNLHLVDKYVIPGLLPPLLLAAVALGLVAIRLSIAKEAFLPAALVPALPVLLFLVEDRIFLPLVPVAAIWAGLGLTSLGDRITTAWPPWGRLNAFHPVLVICCLSLLPYTLRPLYRVDQNDIYKRAGLWIGANQPQVSGVAFPKPWIAHYAGTNGSPVPVGPPGAVALELARTGTTHLVVDSRIVSSYRPELVPLLYASTPVNGLESVTRLTDSLGQVLRVFRVKPTVDGPGE